MLYHLRCNKCGNKFTIEGKDIMNRRNTYVSHNGYLITPCPFCEGKAYTEYNAPNIIGGGGMEMNDLVTIEQFKEQVWLIEGVRINITPKNGGIEHMVRPYNYPRLSEDATVDDLKRRIDECVNKPFITFMNTSKII